VCASVTLLTLLAWTSSVEVARAQSPLEVVASGLFNPRGLAFGPEGALYVVEAGRGGEGTPCLPPVDPAGPRCVGETGAVTRIWPLAPGHQTRVATGLPSAAGTGGGRATGPQDISFQGRGGAFITVGLAGDPNGTERAVWEASGVDFGWLVQMPASGKWKTRVDVAAHEARENPDGEVDGSGAPLHDSNPYGVLALPGRRIVADAGANALVEVAADGSTSTLAVFPRRSAGGPTFQAVPTSVAQGPDGAFYVGQLTGQPFPVGAACVFRVPAGGGTPVCTYGGFTNIIDVTFGPDGSLYVLEIDANGLPTPPSEGRLTRIAPGGVPTVIQTDPALVMPGGVAIGPDGAIYVTNGSVFPGGGQVVRIRP
jgi:glucose/arabinose dehydrogenase